MRTKRTREFIDEVAKNNNLRTDEATEIVESFFRFTAEAMADGNKNTMEFDQIRLMKWGVFKVKEGRKNFFKRLKEKQDEESNNTRT